VELEAAVGAHPHLGFPNKLVLPPGSLFVAHGASACSERESCCLGVACVLACVAACAADLACCYVVVEESVGSPLFVRTLVYKRNL